MEPNIIPAYGCAKLHAAPPDYPCVARLRHRRLLSFLWLHSFKSTFEAMAEETKVLLSLPRLERLIARGMWGEAIGYACRFLPRRPPSLPAQRTHLTAEAQTLLLFLHMHRCFADVVAGNETGAAWSDKHRRRYCLARVTGISSHAIAIRRIIQTFVLSDKIRESMDWGRVREKVVRVVRRLVHDTPELAGFLDLPGGMVKPHNVLPIGFGFRSKRHVRQQRRPRAYTIAQLYLEMKRCVPSSGQPDQGLSLEGLSDKARGWMAHILDSSLRAGCESSEHHQWRYPLRSSEKKGTYMHSSQEDCHTENYCQGFIPRKHQREELAPEEDIDPKRQHTTLTFGEASLPLIAVAEAQGRARPVELSMCAPERAPTGLRRVHYNLLQTRRKLQPVAAACNPFAVRSIHQTPTPMNKRTCLVFHACDVSDLVDLVETTYRPVAEGGCATSGGSPRRSSRAPIEAMTRPRSIGRFIDQLMVRRLVHAHPRRRPPELLQSSTLTAASSSLATSSRQPRTWRVRRLDASRASPGPGRGGTQSRVGRRRRGRWRRSASEWVNQWVTRSASRRTESKTPTESMAPRASSPPAPGGGARARLSLEGRRERALAAANAGQMWNAAWNDDAVASAPERGRRASLFAQDRRPPRVSLQSSPRPAAIARLVPNFRRFPPSSPIPAAIAHIDDDDE
uniref:Uncharacterized protein n=1 Tax=Oryza rufipogon TaxID=4529 RepID=A0A0E0PE04_ORYRU